MRRILPPLLLAALLAVPALSLSPAPVEAATTDAQLVSDFARLFSSSIPGPWTPARTGHRIDRARGLIEVSMTNTVSRQTRVYKAGLRTVPLRNNDTVTYVVGPITPR